MAALAVAAMVFAVESPVVYGQGGPKDAEGSGTEAHVMHLVSKHDLTFGAGLTVIGQKTEDRPDGSVLNYSVDLAFESDLGDQGKAFVYLIDAEGSTIETDAGSGSPNADYEVDDGGVSELRVAEAWYEVPLGTRSSMRLGKIDATGIYDGNNVANDQTTQFLADVFVNNVAIAFPTYTAALSFNYGISDNVAVNVGVFESEGEFTGAASSAFSIAELDLSGQPLGDLPGNLRLTVWEDDANDNEGAALSADQAVSNDLAFFIRYGTQKDTQEFDSALSLGGQWTIGNDAVGFGYSLAYATGVAGPDNEHQMEVYYSHAITEHVHVTADLQHVTNPGFDKSQDDATVYGLRIQTDM